MSEHTTDILCLGAVIMVLFLRYKREGKRKIYVIWVFGFSFRTWLDRENVLYILFDQVSQDVLVEKFSLNFNS